MYRDKDLLGKQVIGADGGLMGDVLEIKVRDDVPGMVIAPKGFLVGKTKAMQADGAVFVPYYDIDTVHDAIILNKNRETYFKEKESLE
jgi:sporulation protein YlmC with PRC-barrel domain